MTRWQRVDKRGAPDWLWMLVGKKGHSFWIRHRKSPYLEQRLEANDWVLAKRQGEELLRSLQPSILAGLNENLIRSEDLCRDLVALRRSDAPATYEQIESMMRNHLIPWLNENCPYVNQLDSTHWDQYKSFKRLENPTVALFNHWKFFVMFAKAAFEKGFIKKKLNIRFKEKKEDFRKEGMLLPEDHTNLIVLHANQVWRDRVTIQRDTGMRPGEVRRLAKSRVEFVGDYAVIRLRKEDTKTRQPREFIVRSVRVLEVLRRRMAGESPFFFPARGNPQSPMDRCLSGWEGAIKRANLELEKARMPLMPTDYTPHDLRHTYATREFKRPGAVIAVICYQLGMSLEEAQKTYLHFKASDTRALADALAQYSMEVLDRA
jgi:integrase